MSDLTDETQNLPFTIKVKTPSSYSLTFKFQLDSILSYTDLLHKLFDPLTTLGIEILDILLSEISFVETIPSNMEDQDEKEVVSILDLSNYFNAIEYICNNPNNNKFYFSISINEENFNSKFLKEHIEKIIRNFSEINKIREIIEYSIEDENLFNIVAIYVKCTELCNKVKRELDNLENHLHLYKDKNLIFLKNLLKAYFIDFEIRTKNMERSVKNSSGFLAKFIDDNIKILSNQVDEEVEDFDF
jgi:hypothetical protein